MEETRRQENPERLKKAKEYEKIHNKLFVLDIALSLIVIVVFIFSGLSQFLASQIARFVSNIWLTVGLYVLVCYVASAFLFLPLNFFSGYILEHRFGLSNETKKMWAADFFKNFGINLVLMTVLGESLHLFVRHAGGWWWVWAGTFWLLLGVLISNIFPVVILPMFYKVKPLGDQDLVGRLVRMSEAVKAKILGVFEMDMSRKSKKANAMFAGVGNTKRIILTDTLVRDYTHEEIESVLAHELGHFYHRHIWKLLGVSAAATFAGLYLTSILLDLLVRLGGFKGIADVAALPLFALVLAVFGVFTMPLTNTYSRILEKEADVFALEKTGNPAAFISSMRKLASQNLSNPEPHPAVEFILYTHPAISKRIKLAERYLK